MTDLVHTVCGTVIAHLARRLPPGDMLRAHETTLPDGTQSRPGNLLYCHECGCPVPMTETRQD